MDARNGRNHSVGRGHGSALSERCTHDVAIGERGGFGERENPVGKTVAPGGQALLQAHGPLVGTNFPNTESDLGNCHRRQCQLRIVVLRHRLRDHVGVEEDLTFCPR
jgi:hypothetical protein